MILTFDDSLPRIAASEQGNEQQRAAMSRDKTLKGKHEK
jgi:hypothetical protein